MRAPKFSLMQLVLLGFLLVLLPLAVLIAQAASTYQQLADQAATNAREAVAFTRRSQAMQATALDLERLSLQYSIVGDAQLLELLASQRQDFIQLLEQPFTLFSISPDHTALQLWLQQDTLEPEYFTQLVELTANLTTQTSQLVDMRLTAMQEQLSHLQSRLLWQFLVLVSLALLLVLIFTWLLIRPLNYLQKRISSLAQINTTPTIQPLQAAPAELLQLDQQIDWLDAQLSALEQQKSQFLRHISHELKTPLASIREAADLLNEQLMGPLNSTQIEVTGLLQQNAVRLQHLIEQLLDYNLLQTSRQPQQQNIDLHAFLTRVLQPWQLLAVQNKQQFILPTHHLNLVADPELLARSLDNLISNALHYGATQQPVYLSAGTTNSSFWIEVTNHGPNIDPQEQTKIFEPFFQGRSQRKGAIKGSGLGLSIAAECMQAQGGQLQLKSSTANKTTFRLEWPLTNQF